MIDLDGDGIPEILLFGQPRADAAAFKAGADGAWTLLGPVLNAQCAGVREALRAGPIAPAAPRFQELEFGGTRLRINTPCPDENISVRVIRPSEDAR